VTISESSAISHLVVIRAVETGPDDFIEFWASRYVDPRESLYDENIGKPLTPESVMALFEWKNGGKLSDRKKTSVHQHYVSRINEPLPHEVRGFLKSFGLNNGGSIWPIFWLHCCNQQFPIFDQHVYRAMTFIQHRESDELNKYSDKQKIDFYLDRYIPFYAQLGNLDRRADKALWMFGKFLKVEPNYL
jgi:hypothetical protein